MKKYKVIAGNGRVAGGRRSTIPPIETLNTHIISGGNRSALAAPKNKDTRL
jgi:hypothetical protein